MTPIISPALAPTTPGSVATNTRENTPIIKLLLGDSSPVSPLERSPLMPVGSINFDGRVGSFIDPETGSAYKKLMNGVFIPC